jgi:hypothetical protein
MATKFIKTKRVGQSSFPLGLSLDGSGHFPPSSIGPFFSISAMANFWGVALGMSRWLKLEGNNPLTQSAIGHHRIMFLNIIQNARVPFN